jgi:hypothetical protein
VKYGENFVRVENQLVYDNEQGFLYEGRNLTEAEKGLKKADLYVNGDLVGEQLPFYYADT